MDWRSAKSNITVGYEEYASKTLVKKIFGYYRNLLILMISV